MKSKREFEDFLMMKKIILSRGNIEVEIVSDSMEPLIKTGELIKVQNVEEDLKLFDIIVFWRDGQFVSHFVWRFNGISHKTITTRSLKDKGANELPVEFENVLGIIKDKKISLYTKVIMRLFYGK
ncbi:hypothetical protein A9Q84_19345 [Halobacteriovorax marinus]|uniref:Peptidase S24/S26A/S26B/S26C domain-containing protein n=1 Tax=Halobacteriovorax marinus TaxID=97084 RepID=A0A1Y5F2G3_9BACT|nr:hypothetical protein A9Q84_19345 [Halobacteriovorax marinus]